MTQDCAASPRPGPVALYDESMTAPRKARSLAIALVLLGFGGAMLAGCAPEGSAAAPSPSASEVSATPTPDPSASTPPASPEPTSEPEKPVGLTQGELLRICIETTTPQFDADARFDDTRARIEKRTVSPEWLVIIPVQTNGYNGQAVCTLGGTADAPDIGRATASIQQLSDEQIQKIIRGEDEGTEG